MDGAGPGWWRATTMAGMSQVHRRQELLADTTPGTVRGQLRRGELVAVRTGLYAPPAPSADPYAGHLLAATAALRSTRHDA